MELTEKLRLWGAAHAAARKAENAARSAPAGGTQEEARVLRERADRLHGEIYRELDRRPQERTRRTG